MGYELPIFVSRILAEQPAAPRRVPMLAVARAVLAGADCAIYAAGGAALIGLAVLVQLSAAGPPAPNARVALVILGFGVLFGLLAAFRIWQVYLLVRFGDGQVVNVVQAEVGRARLSGSPWGEPMMSGGMPIAALGTYRFAASGETGHYYMQQWWAAALRPGQRLWVIRHRGRDVLYAPVT